MHCTGRRCFRSTHIPTWLYTSEMKYKPRKVFHICNWRGGGGREKGNIFLFTLATVLLSCFYAIRGSAKDLGHEYLNCLRYLYLVFLMYLLYLMWVLFNFKAAFSNRAIGRLLEICLFAYLLSQYFCCFENIWNRHLRLFAWRVVQ